MALRCIFAVMQLKCQHAYDSIDQSLACYNCMPHPSSPDTFPPLEVRSENETHWQLVLLKSGLLITHPAKSQYIVCCVVTAATNTNGASHKVIIGTFLERGLWWYTLMREKTDINWHVGFSVSAVAHHHQCACSLESLRLKSFFYEFSFSTFRHHSLVSLPSLTWNWDTSDVQPLSAWKREPGTDCMHMRYKS